MNSANDQIPIRELRRNIEREIAALRVQYGALMPAGGADSPPTIISGKPNAAPLSHCGAPRPALVHRARPEESQADRYA